MQTLEAPQALIISEFCSGGTVFVRALWVQEAVPQAQGTEADKAQGEEASRDSKKMKIFAIRLKGFRTTQRKGFGLEAIRLPERLELQNDEAVQNHPLTELNRVRRSMAQASTRN